MSAWVVEKGHIDALVMAGIQYGILQPDADLDKFGARLWTENYRSVNYRYGESTRRPPYRFRGEEVKLDPHGVVKAAVCYDYQTCEHPQYHRNPRNFARRFVRQLMAAACAEIGADPDVYDSYRRHPSYSKSPWGITHPTQITTNALMALPMRGME